MQDGSFTRLLLVLVVTFLAPFLLDLVGLKRFPSLVLEMLCGILIGPPVLHWVQVDPILSLSSKLGLGYLLFLAGMEVDLERIRRRTTLAVGVGFLISCLLGLAVGVLLSTMGLIKEPLFLAIVLVSTSLGVVTPLLKDTGHLETDLGQLVMVGGTIAEFGPIVLLSLFFSRGVGTPLEHLLELLILGILMLLLAKWICLFARKSRFREMASRLQDTSAQIKVRGAMALFVGSALLAMHFGTEGILGTFLAGMIVGQLSKRKPGEPSRLRSKLEAIGFGVFIPIFFVTSGLRFDLAALLTHPTLLFMVPLFLVALLVFHSVPVWLSRTKLSQHQAWSAVFLLSTSLSFLVLGAQVGEERHLLTSGVGSALLTAGMLSAMLYPLLAMLLLRQMTAVAKPLSGDNGQDFIGKDQESIPLT